jgi:hypothetical protein
MTAFKLLKAGEQVLLFPGEPRGEGGRGALGGWPQSSPREQPICTL